MISTLVSTQLSPRQRIGIPPNQEEDTLYVGCNELKGYVVDRESGCIIPLKVTSEEPEVSRMTVRFERHRRRITQLFGLIIAQCGDYEIAPNGHGEVIRKIYGSDPFSCIRISVAMASNGLADAVTLCNPDTWGNIQLQFPTTLSQLTHRELTAALIQHMPAAVRA